LFNLPHRRYVGRPQLLTDNKDMDSLRSLSLYLWPNSIQNFTFVYSK